MRTVRSLKNIIIK